MKGDKTSQAKIMPSSSFPATTSDVFETGKYKAALRRVEASASAASCGAPADPPPKPLLIAFPADAPGEFPVLVFLHGYLLYNSFYSQLILHVSSHGFVVVAPQLYTVAGPDTTDEINSAAATTNWLHRGLAGLLPPQVRPNLAKLAVAGHSRGGKAAFGLALGKPPTQLVLPFSALLGIDPVDGMDKGKQTPPPMLTYVPRSFELDMPVMVVGSGLGEIKKNPLFPACAPRGVNHADFFAECRPPACYFVAEKYGHMDMLDDETPGVRGKATHCLCKNGRAREPMRRFVGGVVVAFLRAYLEGDDVSLMGLRDGHEVAPVELQKVEFLL
ncbi:hypothetical protein NL676_029531 [Syzygium grande]|nr:hypothetical protein NL676_029531 [Syzygium grande]